MTSLYHPLAHPGLYSSWAALPPSLFPVTYTGVLGCQDRLEPELPRLGDWDLPLEVSWSSFPRQKLRPRSRCPGGEQGWGGARGRATRAVMSGPAAPRSQHVRFSERETKRPAHSCALTHGCHVERCRSHSFAQNWSGGEGGPSRARSRSPAGSLLHACSGCFVLRPQPEDFPKQA